MDTEKSSVQQAIEGRPAASWASIFLDYFDLKHACWPPNPRRQPAFHWASSVAWGNARPRRFQRPGVWDISVVLGCDPPPSELGVEYIDLRRDSYTIQRWCFFSAP
jgi:hypothetical protein